MKIPKFNWPVLAGFVLCLVAFISYPFVFVRWPITRDFPWVNLLLFGIAVVLLLFGVRRAFASGRPLRSKIAGGIVATLGLLVIALFVVSVFIIARQLPASTGAPQVGQKAPEFSLADSAGQTVSLSDLLSTPVRGKPPKGVLLIFYRGYW